MPDIALNEPLEVELALESVVRTPLYFGPDEKQLLGWLHQSHLPSQYDIGVVISPPLGTEYLSAYRAMRYAADYFALAGIPAFRFDYHGTGDSSGFNDDGNRLEAWLWSIEQANSELKRLTGCSRTGILGLRMGATLASLASEKIAFDFLVLWAALESGRKYLREIKAIQMTGIAQDSEGESGLLEAGGMAYWAETEAAIGKIELTQIVPQALRTLVIPRDDLRTNSRVCDAWRAAGVNVEQLAYSGSAEMLVDVGETTVPHESIIKVTEWVKENIDAPVKEQHDVLQVDITTSALVRAGSTTGCGVKESFIKFGKDRDCFAILSEPTISTSHAGLPVIVIVNSGANHRVGPGRLYVTIARELAHLGFRSLRIDIPGLGDSVVNERSRENRDYISNSSDVIHDAIKALGEDYRDYRYVMTGLCSGAYASFHAALDLKDVNIAEAVLINPLTFYWHEGMALEGTSIENFGYWNWYRKAARDMESWKKLLRGRANYSTLVKTIRNRVRVVVSAKTRRIRRKGYARSKSLSEVAEGDLSQDLAKITSNSRHLTFVLASSDPGYDILMTDGGKMARRLLTSGKMSLYMIEDSDHTFSKYKPRSHAINTIVNHIVNRYKK